VISLLEAQERCQKGPLMEDKAFDRKFQLKLREVSAKLNLKLDFAEVIPAPDIADAIFEAAIDFAADIGLYNVDTKRVLQFSRDEIIDTITTRKQKFTIGEGRDMVTVRARSFGDKHFAGKDAGAGGRSHFGGVLHTHSPFLCPTAGGAGDCPRLPDQCQRV